MRFQGTWQAAMFIEAKQPPIIREFLIVRNYSEKHPFARLLAGEPVKEQVAIIL